MSTQVNFKTSAKEGNEVVRTMDLNITLGDTIEENVELFGDAVVLDIFKAQAIIKAQTAVRTRLGARNDDGSFKYTDEQVAEFFDTWKLTGGNRSTKSKSDKALDLVADMTEEELMQLLERHRARKAAGDSDDIEDEEEDESEED